MNQAANDIDAIISGMYEALGGREPNEATARKIEELERERDRAIRMDWHGWECYCFDCCE